MVVRDMGTFRLLCWQRRLAHSAVFWALLVAAAALEVYDEPTANYDYWDENNPKPQQVGHEEVRDETDVFLQKLLKIIQKQQDPKLSHQRSQWNSLEKEPEESNWPRNNIDKRNMRPPPRRSDLMLRLQRVYNVHKEKHLRRVPQVCLFKLCPSGYSKRYF